MKLSRRQIRYLRLRAQGLAGPPLGTPAAVVARLVGVQAQEEAAARLAIRPRSTGLTVADVDAARVTQRDIVTTWAMRSTLHVVTTADLGWLLGLLGPLFVQHGKRRRGQLGIDGDVGRAAMRAIDGILAAEGALTREELASRLAARAIPTEGQAIYHLIGRAGLEGILCAGPPREGQATYVRLDDWVKLPPAEDDDSAAVRLARRYVAGYGPVGPEDFARWSGLALSAARAAFRAFEGELVEATTDGDSVWLLPEQAGWPAWPPDNGPLVSLLPGYDAYLLGYRSRDLIVAPEHARQVHPGGGLIRPALLVDGVIAGIWRLARRGGGLQVVVRPFARLHGDVQAALDREAADVGRFLGVATERFIEEQ